MNLLDFLEEGVRVIREEARIGKTGVIHHMVLEHMPVEKTVSELRVSSCFHESSDQSCLRSELDRLDSKTTIRCGPAHDKLRRFLKHVSI